MIKSTALPAEVILDQPIASQHSKMRELSQAVQRGQPNQSLPQMHEWVQLSPELSSWLQGSWEIKMATVLSH